MVFDSIKFNLALFDFIWFGLFYFIWMNSISNKDIKLNFNMNNMDKESKD